MYKVNRSECELVDGKYEEFSPSGNFKLELSEEKVSSIDGRKWSILGVKLMDAPGKTKYQRVMYLTRQADKLFRIWANKDGKEYFIFGEHLEGQSIVDLEAGLQVSSYQYNDSMIWTDFIFSPDCSRLAVEGCYWGSEYFVRVYDFSNPMKLPLVSYWQDIMIGELDDLKEYYELAKFIDNETLEFIRNGITQRVSLKLKDKNIF